MASILSTLGDEAATRVFLHDVAALPVTGDGERILPGLRFYAERALLMARPHDVVCVQSPVDPDYLGYLAELGIGPRPENVLVAGADSSGATLTASLLGDSAPLEPLLPRIDSEADVLLHPFMATRATGELARTIERRLARPIRVATGRPEIAVLANRKELVHAKAIELGVPVAPGEVVRLQRNDPRPLQAAVARWREHSGRVLIRASEGTGGLVQAVAAAEPAAELRALLAGLLDLGGAGTYLVQVLCPFTASPNVQMHIDPVDGSIAPASTSDQRLTADLMHLGNVAPTSATTIDAMERSARTLCEWLRTEGYRGLVGFDFCETRGGAEGEHFLAEINPRLNAATYPQVLLERVGANAFATTKLRTPSSSFSALRARLSGLLLQPGASVGIVPYGTGCLALGHCFAAALGGSRAEVEALLEEATDRAA